MPPFLLTVLKVLFLGLLFFFVYWAIRAVALDLRGSPSRSRDARAAALGVAPAGGRGRPPRSVVVTDERGSKLGTFDLNGNLQIGRAEACQIRLPDTFVSQFHARIFHRDGGWFVEDLGSTNGTYLNQRRLSGAAELRVGDKVLVGKTVLDARK